MLVFSDNRTGEYDLYAVRTNGNLYTRGREYPVIIDYEPLESRSAREKRQGARQIAGPPFLRLLIPTS